MVDLNDIYNRFKFELELMKECQYEMAKMRFTEMELKQIIYLLGELKAIRGRTDWREFDDDL